ncbi:TetR/AcrR family transcriptional regulator [Oerskovia turbata]
MTDTTEPGLPHAIALAWGVAENPQRGPRRELSIERIVEQAIEIADAEGLAALSMSKLATALGYTTMSLYRYVTSKDDLLLLMQEQAIDVDLPSGARPEVDAVLAGRIPAGDEPTWRRGLREFALATLAIYEAHPWFLDVAVQGVPLTPNNLRFVDLGLRALHSTSLSDEDKLAMIMLVTSYAQGAARIHRELGRARQDPTGRDVSGAAYAEVFAELVTPERFPFLHPVVVSGAYLVEDDGVDDVVFGLERVLDGIGAFVERSPEQRAQSPLPPPEDREAADLYAREPAVKDASKARREAEKAVREAEKRLKEARKRERDALKAARERAARG